ncbi:MAG: type II/IV secretion system ATPase subunit [Candidatus Aenigmarchaeota archaeon]|nr:type II/IV secretion system ATPase subunit [Candidatus Aenigmarchaeota archaeon]
MKIKYFSLKTPHGRKRLVLRLSKETVVKPLAEEVMHEIEIAKPEEKKYRLNIKIKPKVQKEEGIRKGYTMTMLPPPMVSGGVSGFSGSGGFSASQSSSQPAALEGEGKFSIVGASLQGIAIPEIRTQAEVFKEKELEAMTNETTEDLKIIDIKYPLIPSKPKTGERVFAYAHITFDKRSNELVYSVVEPRLDETGQKLLEDIKDYIQEKINIDFSQVRQKNAMGYIADIFDLALEYLKPKIDESMEEVLKYYVFRDFVGLEKIEPLLSDRFIEDISCDGIGINIYIYHRNPRFGTLKTNVSFGTMEELDTFVNKLAERCGRVISISKPLLDATLPDGSRVQATLGSDIARRGSNFTVRMFTEEPMTPLDIIRGGTCDARMMAYYWLLIEHGSSFLISGGTATGKTSLLNVLSLFIKPQMKIVSIEDTSELRLPHAHWIPEVARTPISEEGKVDMFELLKESLRQRPDYIIVGEVRGQEAYVLFQQMAIGHPGLSTIHAENFSKLIDRLTSPPINLPPNLLENLDVVIFLRRVKHGRRYIRRINTSVEITGFDRQSTLPVMNEIFSWSPHDDSFKTIKKSMLLRKIAALSGMAEGDIEKELETRAKVLEWMVLNNIKDYKKVAAIINMFYASKGLLLAKLGV